MAAWKFACKTLQGMDLDLKLVSREGLPLRLTRAVSGAGSISPTQLMGLKGVLEPVQELQLLDAVEHLGDHRVLVPVVLRNAGVRTGYSMYQLGVYAEDPDFGEVLYMVMQSEGAEEVPSSAEMPDFKLEWYINVTVANADEVEVVIDETGVLTVEQADARYVFLKEYSEAVAGMDAYMKENREKILSHLDDKDNPHDVTKYHVGLGNVDDTADMDKPVSTAQQAAIDAAREQAGESLDDHVNDTNNPHKVTKAQVGLGSTDNTPDAEKPVSAPQQAALDALYEQLAAYTRQQIANLINGAPSSLDTLKEVADAISAHKTIMDALDAAIGKKANAAEFDSHVKDTVKHITAAERTNWNGKLAPTGNASDTTVVFSQASSRENISSGNKLSVIMGKIMKWLADLKAVAFSGSYNDLSNRPTIGNGTITIKQAGTSKGSFTVNQAGNTTIELTDSNTTYGVATQSANGLQSAADKKKLDGIPGDTGAQLNALNTGMTGISDLVGGHTLRFNSTHYTGSTTVANLFSSLSIPSVCITSTENVTDKPAGKYGVIVIFKFSASRMGAVCICTDASMYVNAWNAGNSSVTGWKEK